MRAMNWVRALLGLSCLTLLSEGGEALTNKCQRTPKDVQVPKIAGDNGFRIKISGNPEKYVPGEVYTVSLQGWRTQYSVQKKFIGFVLVVETATPSSGYFGHPSVGTFQLYADALTMHSSECSNAVTHTSTIPKSEVQVLWNAPPAGSGCVRFRATVIEQNNVWYMDDGELTKELCEEIQENEDMQPIVIEDCCACDEAKYEVTFEGLWSRQTHPKDFPTNEWLTHFSDIIGASHSADYRVWEYGGYASDGLRQVAEWGSTRALESELKSQSKNIRTIIKARGLWYPNVNGKTFAVFRVDNHHHLMSLVSMLGPSPDWIVGVSALELCLRNCSWVEKKTLNLYPWDAGTDSSLAYTAASQPTIPREKIRRISNSSPNDPRSPFYDPTGLPMKPLAKLTITRQRVYEKSCSDSRLLENDIYVLGVGRDEDADRHECAVTEWSSFTPCSMTCGKGLRERIRTYLMPMKANMMGCNRQLVEKEMCAAAIPTCEGGSINDIFGRQIHDPKVCMTTDWSAWSPCSVTCGRGYTKRTRTYFDRMGRKKCDKDLVEKQPCSGDISECDPSEAEKIDPACAVTQWSDWSPCTRTCGVGVQVRIRSYLTPIAQENCNVTLSEKIVCGEGDCTISREEANEVCKQKIEVGPCRGYFQRYYFDTEKNMCIAFTYGGCRGNRNNFETYDECTKTCEISMRSIDSRSLVDSRYVDQAPTDSFRHQPYVSSPPVDCQISKWGDWSTCNVTCGKGMKTKARIIQQYPLNGGKSCPSKMVKYRNCKGRHCPKEQKKDLNSYYHQNKGLQSFNLVWRPDENEQTESIIGDTGESYDEDQETYDQLREAEDHEEFKLLEIDDTNVDCVTGQWGPWSPCTHSCGNDALQQRARSVIVKQRGNGQPCGPRLERRMCKLPPCPRPRQEPKDDIFFSYHPWTDWTGV